MTNESALFEDDFTVDLDDLSSPTKDTLTDEINDFANQVVPASDSCLLYTSPSPRDLSTSRMPSSA